MLGRAYSVPMKTNISIVTAKVDSEDGLIVTFSDGTITTQEFATHRCDDLSLVFTHGRQPRVSLMQSVLCLSCNFFSLIRRALLSFAQSSPDGGRTPITPCCFDHDPSQERVAGLRDAASSNSLATGVLARHSASIAHQFSSTCKARDLAQLSANRSSPGRRPSSGPVTGRSPRTAHLVPPTASKVRSQSARPHSRPATSPPGQASRSCVFPHATPSLVFLTASNPCQPPPPHAETLSPQYQPHRSGTAHPLRRRAATPSASPG